MKITIGPITATFWVWVVIVSGTASVICFVLARILKWMRS